MKNVATLVLQVVVFRMRTAAQVLVLLDCQRHLLGRTFELQCLAQLTLQLCYSIQALSLSATTAPFTKTNSLDVMHQ